MQQGHRFWQGYSCLAADRLPNEAWAPNQRTPLCTKCEAAMGACHFCRGQQWATPPTPGGVLDSGSVLSEADLERERVRQESGVGTTEVVQEPLKSGT